MAMRLLTRSDFDGICCAVLLKEMGIIDRMTYAHPKDLQDGTVQVTKDDVLANVPYVEGCGLWFDHHLSEEERLKLRGKFKGRCEPAPSAARVIYNYYYYLGKLHRFEEMLEHVDRVDSAQLTEDEIINPGGWILLGFLCDPRTGLGYHHGFRVSNIKLMEDMVDYLREKPVGEILALPDVKERVERYFEFNEKYREFLLGRSRTDGPAVITDTRGAEEIPPGNRFLIYSLFPEASISIRLIDGKGGKTVTISVGHSITNRVSTVNVGLLMLKYGGGGHRQVGACQVPLSEADRAFGEILEAIKAKP